MAVLDWLMGRLGELFERRAGNPPLDELARIFDGYMTIIADFPRLSPPAGTAIGGLPLSTILMQY